ncbi:MAG TPA: hypothetical protein VE732_04440 [Nitrososphaera sp.]|jgi:hypothetical protein|nr:hypothetical protein [Nitrososphaera sp.]
MFKKEEAKSEAHNERVLQWAITLFVGGSIWSLMHYLELSSDRAFLVAGVVAALLVYWIPPMEG